MHLGELNLTFAHIFLIVMNNSQIPLNVHDTISYQSKIKHEGNGMLDLAIQVLAVVGLFALPFIFMMDVRCRVRHAPRATSKEA